MEFSWKLAFHSGMSAKSDLRAAVDEGVPVGVVATLLDLSKVYLTLPRHLDNGGAAFVDSGAFAAFQKGETVNWDRVFQVYESILMMTSKPEGLSIVAPDVIGDQAATLELWARHAVRVGNWIAAGARVIVPLQCGALNADQLLDAAKEIFGTERFSAGIPSNLAAMGVEDTATLHHSDFHILGRVVLTEDLREKLGALLANNPFAIYTSDANWLRSRLGAISRAKAETAPNPSSNPMDSSRTRAVREVLRVDAYQYKQRDS